MAVAFSFGSAFADPEGTPDAERLYKFNIIGMQNPKNVNMDQGSGKVIFVNLNEPSQINLVCSDDEDVLDLYDGLEAGEFAILDKDATDSADNDDQLTVMHNLANNGRCGLKFDQLTKEQEEQITFF